MGDLYFAVTGTRLANAHHAKFDAIAGLIVCTFPPLRNVMRNKEGWSHFSGLQASALTKDIRLLSTIVGTPPGPGWTVVPYPQLHELDKLNALLANEPIPLPLGPYERKDEVLKKPVTNDGSVRMGDGNKAYYFVKIYRIYLSLFFLLMKLKALYIYIYIYGMDTNVSILTLLYIIRALFYVSLS